MIVQVTVPLFSWKDGDQYVAYSPALEVSSFGDTERDAIESFGEAASLFIETAVERNVLSDMLESLGWQRIGSNWRPQQEPVSYANSYPLEIPIC